MKLDAKAAAALALEPAKRDVIHFDSALSGFGLRIRRSTNGKVSKSWIVQYRQHGATRRILVGSVQVLSAEQARTAAKTLLAKIALKQDPRPEKATLQFTLAHVAADYIAAKEPDIRPRSMVETRRYLTGKYFKSLHSTPIDKIQRRDVAARLLVIARESGNVTAARARSHLSSLYAWGMGQGLCEANPVIGSTRPPASPPRERVLDDNELATIWHACADDNFGKIVKLLILTGQRRTEVGGMAWSELSDGTWTIPGIRTKNHREHELPLSALAQSIVASVPRIVGSDYLFSERGHGFTGWAIGKSTLGDKVQPRWTLHDLRRTAATRMCDLGIAPHVVEQILNHQSGHRAGIVGIYNKSRYTREVRAAVALWADHVRSVVEGGERKVVAFSTPARAPSRDKPPGGV
jgi:integrase